MSSDPGAPASATPSSGVLLRPASTEALLAHTQRWAAEDAAYTKTLGALDGAIADARRDLRARSLTIGAERPGAASASPRAAISALETARQRVASAVQARAAAGARLHRAREAAELALTDASDVLLARRVIAAVVVALGAVGAWVVFGG